MEQSFLKSIKTAIAHWWVSLILGILFVAMGVWILFAPLEGYVTISITFSVILFVSGIMEIFFATSNSKVLDGWGWYLTGGILDFILGFILIIYPGLTMAILPYFLGFWLLFRGIMAMGTSFDLKAYQVKGWGWILVTGIAAILLSFMIIANPLATGVTTILIFTSFAFFAIGIYRILLSLELRKLHKIGKELDN